MTQRYDVQKYNKEINKCIVNAILFFSRGDFGHFAPFCFAFSAFFANIARVFCALPGTPHTPIYIIII